MAQVVLTNAQKELVFADPNFKTQVKWAILNKASFWKGIDGTSVPGGQIATSLARWAKSRLFSSILTNNPAMADSDVYGREFLVFAKNYPCVNNSITFDTSSVISYLLSDPINNFDALADNWFDSQTALSPF